MSFVNENFRYRNMIATPKLSYVPLSPNSSPFERHTLHNAKKVTAKTPLPDKGGFSIANLIVVPS